jgi:hypothetical protein
MRLVLKDDRLRTLRIGYRMFASALVHAGRRKPHYKCFRCKVRFNALHSGVFEITHNTPCTGHFQYSHRIFKRCPWMPAKRSPNFFFDMQAFIGFIGDATLLRVIRGIRRQEEDPARISKNTLR